MDPDSTARATRFRGEGRPKRRLSPSPPPKPPVSKQITPKKTGPKAKDTTAVSSSKASSKKKPASPSPEEEPEDEILPTDYKEGQPFPTVKEQQPHGLPLRTYKSIAESGVLNTALEKSRQRWLVEGLFEKFWVKYSRKHKDEPVPSNQSMTKLNGDCCMVVEPHSFKVTLFSVKVPPNSRSAKAGDVPASTSGTPTHATTTPQPSNAPITNPRQAETKPPSPVSVPPVVGLPKPEHHQSPLLSQPGELDGDGASTPLLPDVNGGVPPGSQAGRQDNTNSTDPVIQMLAARAATDHELKSLMKVVAQGDATQDQLSIFQRHIDELNGIIQSQKHQPTNGGGSESIGQRPQAPLPGHKSFPVQTTKGSTSMSNVSYPAPYISRPPDHPGLTMKQEPFTSFFHHSTAATPKQKTHPSTKPVLSAIAFEFNEASGIRYLLPRNSILEYLPGNTQVLMSFLIVRKGDAAVGGRYRPKNTYYQPVTVRLVADHAKLLEPLARVVEPPDEVRQQMLEIMNSSMLAEHVYLATRLPRPAEDPIKAEDIRSMKVEEELKSRYDAPDSILPLAASEL